MVLLAGLAIGFALAIALGGKPSRLLELRLRDGWAVAAALAVQIVLFSRAGAVVAQTPARALHLVTYLLLGFFVWRNRGLRSLLPLAAGMLLNAVAIAANGGAMPLSRAAARSVGLDPSAGANVAFSAHRLSFLGDVFALPRALPFATVVSPGDVLIVAGTIALVTLVSLGDRGAATLDARRLREPFRLPAYRRLAAATVVSQLGDWATIAAVVGWVYRGTGSTGDVALFMLVRLAPPILGGGLAAVVVDRLPRRGLLVGLELLRGVCVAGALAAVLQGSTAGVLLALACAGGLAAVWSAATASLVPSLLPPEQLPAANGGLALLKDLAMAAGAAGAGAALASGAAAPALAVDIGTFAVAAVLLRGLRATPAGRRQRTREGFRALRAHRLVLLLVACFGTATVATGLVNATLPSLLAHRGLGAGGYGFGMAALAAGAAVGEAIVALSALAPTADRWIGGGLLALAGLFGVLALADYGPTAILCLAGIGLVDGSTDVVYSTVLQRESAAVDLGAVFGLSASVMSTGMVAAFAVAPLADRFLGASGAVGVAGGVLAAGGVLGLVAVSVARRPRAVPGATLLRPAP